MKPNRSVRAILVATVLGAALVFAVLAVGCFGGDESDTTATTSLADGGVTTLTSMIAGTTLVADADAFSSFKSKDPFIPQAQATTTSAPVATTTVTTQATTSSTIVLVTTTAPHRLTLTSFLGGGAVSFTLDSVSFSGVTAGNALYTGPWGSIQVVAVNDTGSPFEVEFLRNGTAAFTLELGEYRTW